MTSIFFKKQQRSAYNLPRDEPCWTYDQPPDSLLRQQPLPLPSCSELELMRHFSGLAQKNIGIDTHAYFLGSCTMKLNPRINEWAASLPAFLESHPLAPEELVQGNLRIMGELIEFLASLTGMAGGSLLPNAGAQGEFAGIKMIRAFHRSKGDLERTQVLVPDSAHGTNPATAHLAGFEVVPIRSDGEGEMDLEELQAHLSPKTAALMLTNPSTLGLFSRRIEQIADLVHRAGGRLYYDGANLNAIMEIVRPGHMGFDVMHINLHKTFSTPHGGGGPGSGPVLCSHELLPFLPLPRVVRKAEGWKLLWDTPDSIGQLASFHGNFAIVVRGYLYARLHGKSGLRRVSEMAVVHANYLKTKLQTLFKAPFSRFCMHEFILQMDRFAHHSIGAWDLAKRLLDYGFHAPTVHFPLIVPEAFLIEPTETEAKPRLDAFVEALRTIAIEAEEEPERVKTAPHSLSVGRLDEVCAARYPHLQDVW